MIVSHRHGLIFLKTQKTGGTSVELALSQLCGPEDVITPLTEEDEELRGEVKAQNVHIPPDRRPPWSGALAVLGASPKRSGQVFHEHMNAAAVRRAVGAETFGRYLKTTIVRNPWDREVSLYFWANRGEAEPPPFERWVRRRVSRPERKTWEIYALGDRVVADVVMRYENLEAEFAALLERIGHPREVALPRAKGAYRPPRDYRAFYDPETAEVVARRYAREIAWFGMTFD